ncbi:hypothetical protein AKJ09_00174 [Labilithrix luteola]|uniref:Uncharacterized protein n=1 Tax=Labilithrix luteola TaxID=1391654 RepID=A0A0K1PJ11_9BACT|nr:hypothetical protein AKJ09_00174 [Labilithrix luteola]
MLTAVHLVHLVHLVHRGVDDAPRSDVLVGLRSERGCTRAT